MYVYIYIVCAHTALHLAVTGNYRQITVLLLQSGVDVNMRDKQGCTALHYVQSKTVLKVAQQDMH
jgi:ankyrin repeat protein